MFHQESLDEKILLALLDELLLFILQLYGKKCLLMSGAGQHRGTGEQAASAEFVSVDTFLGLEQKRKIWVWKRCWKEQRL